MNRIVIITGSTRGIGYSTAIEFLRHGDRVVVFCRHKEHVDKTLEDLLVLGGKDSVFGLIGDVRKQKDVRKIVDDCLKRFGRIDVLINNAGIAAYKPIEATSEKEWDAIIDTNLKGTFLFLRHVVPVMKRQAKGVIVNISSALGISGEANFTAYCASKFGVVGLTQAIADEVSQSGIRVYAVLPWAVDTTLLAGSDLVLDPSEVLKSEYVAKRIFAVVGGGKSSRAMVKVHP